jgi:ferredoxin-NADP reductase
MERFEVVVVEAWTAAKRVCALTLARPNGDALPDWTAGAHVDVLIPDVGARSYSLIETTAPDGPARVYRLGVLRESDSRGGSQYMHGLVVGDRLMITPPSNDFPLADGDEEVVLLAGGIGVTPLLSMARDLVATGRRFSFAYAGRSRAEIAFVDDVMRLGGARATIHIDDEAGAMFDLRGLMRGLDAAPLYLCGPPGMITAALAIAQELRWAEGRLRYEIFAAPSEKPGDQPFEVELKSSGRIYEIPCGKTILDVLLEAGEEPLHDCRRGDCGICQVAVLDGVPDHRDFILTESEKAANAIMQICVSRAKSYRLTLDL